MAKQYVKDLKSGEPVKSFFSVKYKHKPREYKNGFMFDVGLADKSGEIELSYFGGKDADKVNLLFESFSVGDIIYVEGYAKIFNKKLRLTVNEEKGKLRKAEVGEFADEDFLYVTNQDVDAMFDFIIKHVDEVENKYIKQLLEHFFKNDSFAEKFKRAPAAMYMHHSCIGGLLEHTWGILRICKILKELHPSLDMDLLISGSILHDIGKIKEFEVTSNIKVSEEGMLLSHVFIGADMVSKAIDKIDGFPKVLRNKILHTILSHHGEMEYGALKKPQFPEAVAIALADKMDSQITQYIRIKKDTKEKTEDFRTYSKYLGEIYLE